MGNHARFAVVRQNPDHTFAVIQSSQCAQPPTDNIVRIQEKAGVYEQNMWLKRGAVLTSTGLWRTHDSTHGAVGVTHH